jgi:hypothetical protein
MVGPLLVYDKSNVAFLFRSFHGTEFFWHTIRQLVPWFAAKILLGAIKISSNEIFFSLDVFGKFSSVFGKFSSVLNFSSEFLGSVFDVFENIVHSFHFCRKYMCFMVVKYEG